MSDSANFRQWCIVEIYGHQKYAGMVSEAEIGGCKFVRVDIPAENETPAFTKFFGQGAIFSMTPVSEAVAVQVAKSHRRPPVEPWDFPKLASTASPLHRSGEEPDEHDCDLEEI